MKLKMPSARDGVTISPSLDQILVSMSLLRIKDGNIRMGYVNWIMRLVLQGNGAAARGHKQGIYVAAWHTVG